MSTPPPPPPPYGPGDGQPRWAATGQPPTYGSSAAPTPPPAYPGAAGPAYGAQNPFESRGTTILVLGILSLVFLLCCVGGVLGIIGWVLGHQLKKEAASAGWPEPGNAKAGRVCSIIGTSLFASGLVVYVFALIARSASTN